MTPSSHEFTSLVVDSTDETFKSLGLRRKGSGGVWAVVDPDDVTLFVWSKLSTWGGDYRGRQFTFEFERAPSGKREKKLGGTCRIDQLLTDEELIPYMELQAQIVSSLPPPADEFVQSLPADLRGDYLAAFIPDRHLPHPGDLWMRFVLPEHVLAWCELIVASAPALTRRARQLDPAQLLLGKRFEFEP